MMQGTANVAKAMQTGPESCPENHGQPGTGEVSGEQVMGKETDIHAPHEAGCSCGDSDTAQTNGHEGASAYFHPQGGYPTGAPQGAAYPGQNPSVSSPGPVHPLHQMPGGPYPYGAYPAPQSAGPGAQPMGYQQPSAYSQAPGTPNTTLISMVNS